MADYRVLILLPAMQWYGQEKALLTVATALREEKVHCHFLIHQGWGEAIGSKLSELGFPWTALPFGTIWSLSLARREPAIFIKNFMGVIRSSWAFWKLLRQVRPTHLLTGNATFTGYILPVLLLTKLPVIYRHGEEVAGHSLVHKALNLILYRRVNQNIANCSFLVNRLKKRFNRINIKVIYNLPPIAVGTKKSSISASSIKVEGKVILLYVGQITVQKGVPMLLEAFKELLKRYHNLELHLIGDVPGIGNTKENATGILLSQYQAELPDQLFYHGRQEETSAYYQFSDIHICPSIYGEHSANVIFEAKYHALPSVIFAVGGLPELIDHQRDGYICHDITPSALADGIEYFLENTERRHQAGLTARSNLAEKYGVERFKQQWVRILDAASEQHGSRQKDVT